MLKKALPKPTDASCLDKAQKCLHYNLRHSCCTPFFNTSHASTPTAPPKLAEHETEPSKVSTSAVEKFCPVCQNQNARNNERMLHCCTGSVRATGSGLTGLKDVGTRCMQHLGQILQLKRWKSDHTMASSSVGGNFYPGNGGGNRDLKRFLEELGGPDVFDPSRIFLKGTLPNSTESNNSRNVKPAEANNIQQLEQKIFWSLLSTTRSNRVLPLLDLVGFSMAKVGTNPKEARYWLKQFQLVGGSSPTRPFAVVQVDQEIFQHSQQLKALSSNLAFLHRNDMKLLVVHGAKLPDDKSMSDLDLQNSRHQVTTETMVLVNFLEASGAPAHPIFSGSNVLRAENIGGGTMGRVTNVNKEALEWCISSGHIPVLSSIGETSSSQLVSVDAAQATAEVAKAVQAMKVLFLNTTGGLRDRSGRIIEEVHIPADLDGLMKQSCSGQDHHTKKLMSGLVAHLPPLSSVVITSARTILTELFTHHGAGTMFKKSERILKYKSIKDVDIDRLKKLITRSFGRVLKDNYIEELEGRLHTIYLSEGYSAVAIITQETGVSIPYLDKFSISLQRQGEGTSDMLWNCVRRDFPSLFWRSKISNNINAWYFKRSEGSWSNTRWTVFWYGISNQQLSYTLVEWAVKKPRSFHEPEDEEEWAPITESL